MHSKAPLLLLVLIALSVYPGCAQQGKQSLPPSLQQFPQDPLGLSIRSNDGPFEDIRARMLREQMARLNAEHQLQARADATRLAQLSNELQDELLRSNGTTLPATVFKKADEIIKLAKSVKNKMRPM